MLDVLGKGIAVDDRMILVYPNYYGGVPSVIREFLQKNKFQIVKDAQLVLVITYGNITAAPSSPFSMVTRLHGQYRHPDEK